MNTNILLLLAFIAFAYLSGSLTPSIWITKWLKGVDVRDSGSGHATTTNTIRQAGFGPGALVFLLDFAKGFIPVFAASRFLPGLVWLVPVAAAAVIGHCWPIFAGFRGGMGLATAGGSLLAVYPISLLVAVVILVVLLLTVRHAARATVFTALLVPFAFWLAGFGNEMIGLGTALALVIAVRFLSNWNRKYRELWLDREKKDPS